MPPKVKIKFEFDTGKFKDILPDRIEAWKKAYPKVDIEQEILKAEQWSLANPDKAKKNWAAFLVRWFSKSQNRKEEPVIYAVKPQEDKVSQEEIQKERTAVDRLVPLYRGYLEVVQDPCILDRGELVVEDKCIIHKKTQRYFKKTLASFVEALKSHCGFSDENIKRCFYVDDIKELIHGTT